MTINQLRQYADSGLSSREAAKIVGMSKSGLFAAAKKFGVTFHGQKSKWKRNAEADFELPVRDVVLSFAHDRYSKRLTAGILGITVQTLTNYCRKEKIVFCKRAELRDECKPRPGKNPVW